MKNLKRNILVVAVLVFVGVAVYLNYSYNNKWNTDGDDQTADNVVQQDDIQSLDTILGGDEQQDATSTIVSEYFAQARLTREESRDAALNLLESAVSSEGATQEVIDSAVNAISVMAAWTMRETQIESKIIAKGFADCVVLMSDDGITVAVAAPETGMSEADAARITEIVTSETDYTAAQLNVIEIVE